MNRRQLLQATAAGAVSAALPLAALPAPPVQKYSWCRYDSGTDTWVVQFSVTDADGSNPRHGAVWVPGIRAASEKAARYMALVSNQPMLRSIGYL